MLQAIKKLDKKIEALQKERSKKIKAMQARCKHPHASVYEVDYEPMNYLPSMPPFRVCTKCGYAEEGWGCGYKKLGKFDYEGYLRIDRDRAMDEHVLTFKNQDGTTNNL